MTYDSQELLTLFGRLFQQRAFVATTMHSLHLNEHAPQNNSNKLRLLNLLTQHDQLTNSEIVEDLDIRPSSVSALVAKLEDAQLITRQASAEDKRVMLIRLTERGRTFLREAHQVKDDLSEALFKTLSASQQEQLRTILQKLVTDLEKRDPKDWAGNAEYRAFMEQAQMLRHHGHRGFGGGFRMPHDF